MKEILAVTFTNKAAAQMRTSSAGRSSAPSIGRIRRRKQRARLREQLADVPGADISTIHSFCSRLIRSHFFAAGVDGSFSVIGSDDAAGSEAAEQGAGRACSKRRTTRGRKNFSACFPSIGEKSDNNLRKILLSLYDKLRERADYREFMQNFLPFTEEKFDRIAAALFSMLREKCDYYAALAEKEEEYFRAVGRTKSEKNAKTVRARSGRSRASRTIFPPAPCPRKAAFPSRGKRVPKRTTPKRILCICTPCQDMRFRQKGHF